MRTANAECLGVWKQCLNERQPDSLTLEDPLGQNWERSWVIGWPRVERSRSKRVVLQIERVEEPETNDTARYYLSSSFPWRDSGL